MILCLSHTHTHTGRDLYSNIPPVQWAAGLEEAMSHSAVGPQTGAGDDNEVTGAVSIAKAEARKQELFPYIYPHGPLQGQEGQQAEIPCFVQQLAGDVLFVPNMWSHQVPRLALCVFEDTTTALRFSLPTLALSHTCCRNMLFT